MSQTMTTGIAQAYEQACRTALAGDYETARRMYHVLLQDEAPSALCAQVQNDLGTLAGLEGNVEQARRYFEAALELDTACQPARANLTLLQEDETTHQGSVAKPRDVNGSGPRIKIAIVSFLFNWPSSGGGIIHTIELARFLERAGYEVRLICPRFTPWGIGRVDDDCPFPVEVLEFGEQDWNVGAIQARFREAVGRFDPDQVIVTDCWNMKPHLSIALEPYPVWLRMQAQECLCPLNNLRLLPDGEGAFRQCPRNRLASPGACTDCLSEWGHTSGGLHQAERELSRAGTRDYDALLRRALQQAEGVLVLNPLIAEMVRPYCRRVEVVTWGMDAARFPWPRPSNDDRLPDKQGKAVTRILFAGLAGEPIKGFRVLYEACQRLSERRQDFELIVTSDPPGSSDPFTRWVGWQSQRELPRWFATCDICAVPTVAQDGLSRTSVEAMASGRPVIASNIGGLPYSVIDGITGLLCQPGNVSDWARKLDRLLDDRPLRGEMGRAGRRQFEQRFTWEQVIEQQYRPLLVRRAARVMSRR